MSKYLRDLARDYEPEFGRRLAEQGFGRAKKMLKRLETAPE